MNILYVAHRIPYPPNKGDKLRSFHQLEYLARRHRVWCACFVDRAEDWPHVAAIRELCVDVAAFKLRPRLAMWRAIRGLLTRGNATCGYYHDPGLAAALANWARQVDFDAVVAFSSSMAPYALQVPAGHRVLDLCDCDSQKWLDYSRASLPPKRWLYHLEGRRLSEFENECVRRFDQTIVISRSEAECLHNVPGKSVRVIANGIRAAARGQVCGTGIQPVSAPVGNRCHNKAVVGFVGALDYRPNVDAVCWFARTCWPAVRAAQPTAVFRIVGHSPVRAVRRLAKIPGVQVVGPVAEVQPEIRGFDVSVAPLRIALGLQNKVLEAMAYAKPIVLTSGAADGICGRDGQHFLVADQPEHYARAVVGLLSDARLRVRLGRSARRLVSRHYHWEPLLREFERIVTGNAQLLHAKSASCEPAASLENDSAHAGVARAALPI